MILIGKLSNSVTGAATHERPPDARAHPARSCERATDWTLKEMSERSGIPVSTLSKVEHDRLTLTYDKLQQLSQRLQIRDVGAVRRDASRRTRAVTARRSIGRHR